MRFARAYPVANPAAKLSRHVMSGKRRAPRISDESARRDQDVGRGDIHSRQSPRHVAAGACSRWQGPTRCRGRLSGRRGAAACAGLGVQVRVRQTTARLRSNSGRSGRRIDATGFGLPTLRPRVALCDTVGSDGNRHMDHTGKPPSMGRRARSKGCAAAQTPTPLHRFAAWSAPGSASSFSAGTVGENGPAVSC